jgi:hypothetical protein
MEMNNQPKIVKDTGIEPELLKQLNEKSVPLKQYADSHRRYIREAHKLGLHSHLSPVCGNCGHRICRCSDIRRRNEMEAVDEATRI